jgi:hypothetical protein
MSVTARLQLGSAGPDGTRAATVTDQGGLLVHGAIVPAQRQPGGLPLTLDDIALLVATAARAPSVHNTQPWKFRATGNVIDLLADPDRMLTHADPAGRELMISCGGALFGLRLGLRRLGYLPQSDLLPDPADRWLVARVRPVGRAAVTRTEAELLAAVPHRHTHRGPFSPGEVPARLLAALQLDAAAEGAHLVLIEHRAQIATLAGIVGAAAAEQRASENISAELRRWVQLPGSQARDGVPAHARVPSGDVDAGPRSGAANASGQVRLPQRDFGQPGTEEPGGEPPSATAVLLTGADTPADWVRAGQALHRLLLSSATRWVFASLQSQPLESPRFRAQLRAELGLAGHPQMLLQFGRSNTTAATARRPQAELMTDD